MFWVSSPQNDNNTHRPKQQHQPHGALFRSNLVWIGHSNYTYSYINSTWLIWFHIGLTRQSVGPDSFRLLAVFLFYLEKLPIGLISIPSLTYQIVKKYPQYLFHIQIGIRQSVMQFVVKQHLFHNTSVTNYRLPTGFNAPLGPWH